MKKVMKKARTALLAALVLAAFVLPATGAEERTLNLSTLAPLTTIDPHATTNIQDIMFHRQIFEPLFFQNEATGKYEPRVAESYTISPDNLTYTFTIRKGAKFHNGEDVKASDVAFSLKRAMNSPKVRSYTASVAEVTQTGDYTVDVKLKQPNAAFLNNQNMILILSQKEVEAQGKEFGTKLTLAGTGPFYLTSLQHDVEWTCAAFKDYYRGEAPIRKLHYVPIAEASAGLIAFESGELDWYIAPIANWSALTANPNYKTELVPANHISYVAVNYEHGPLNDDNIRLAIACAIDKDAMNIACYDGNAVNADFMVPPQNTGAPTKGVVYNYDPEKAKEYVKKSAYPNGTHVGTINCSAGGYFEKMAQVLQSNLADIGLTSDINRLDSATNLDMARNQRYDLLCTGFSPYGDYESIRMYSYTKMKGAYMVKFEGDKFDYRTMDALWDAGIATTDLAEREKIYSELSDWIAKTATLLPIFHKVQPYVWTPDLIVPVNYPNYPQVYEWSWAKK
ncbi:MAG: ABC transporter substrate-binding protein [Synergistaceae bacterium]|nr:ABC transporter substrate-binding protein [Synergistaceae bacterium]